ncbi:hypothetical protein AB0I81_46160 [Nonomuraea sp. NPDC050404]|uniref:hypothetical protein n=1 Tax=Nonomuraea sp. NPDC050404 TaxID=3155783 RepID=UPI0033DB6857
MPDLVGAVLLASAVAAGVLAISRGSAWGRSSSRSLGRAGAFAVLATGSPIPWRDRWRPRDPRRRDGPAAMTAALVAVARAAVLLAATAQVRVAGASGRETGPRSQRAAEEGPAMSRRLLAGPRGDPDQVRGEAEKERARFGAFCPSPTGTTNPR